MQNINLRHKTSLFMGATIVLAGCAAHSADAPADAPANDARPAAQKPLVMKVWNGNPPNFVATAGPEIEGKGGRIQNISDPTIEVYLPDKAQANGVAFIYCAGGGYSHLAGLGAMAARFVPEGIAVIDLKYRTHMPSPNVTRDSLADAQRALRLVRSHAAQWNINPQKIGIMGTSAGANVALNLATHSDGGDATATDSIDRQSSRPDFVALLSFWPYTYSTKNFPITAGMPPTFMVHAQNDTTAKPDKAEEIVAALKTASVPVEMNMYPGGGHGVSAIGKGPGGKWPQKFLAWMEEQKFMTVKLSNREISAADFTPVTGGTVTASSQQTRYPAQNTLDEKVPTFWVSSGPQVGVGPTPQNLEWLQLAFATPQTVNAIKVLGRPGYGPKQCALQVSDDGKSFRTIHEFTLENGVENIVPFAPVKATTFRLAFSSAYDQTKPDAPRSVQVSELALLAPK